MQNRARMDEDEKLCVICMVNAKNFVLMPCKHMKTCSECAMPLKECPMCQAVIDHDQTLNHFEARM